VRPPPNRTRQSFSSRLTIESGARPECIAGKVLVSSFMTGAGSGQKFLDSSAYTRFSEPHFGQRWVNALSHRMQNFLIAAFSKSQLEQRIGLSTEPND
jgi:hypothetical protein